MESAYWALSGGLLRTASFVIDGATVTDYEPLYPLFLAGARMLAGDRVIVVQVIQIAVASLGALFLYHLSLLLTGQRRPSMIAGVLFAIHPLLVRQAAAPSDLALATTLLVTFAYAFVSIRGPAGAVTAGACIGLAVLTRSMTLPVLAGGVVVLIGTRRASLVLPFVVAATLAHRAVCGSQLSGQQHLVVHAQRNEPLYRELSVYGGAAPRGRSRSAAGRRGRDREARAARPPAGGRSEPYGRGGCISGPAGARLYDGAAATDAARQDHECRLSDVTFSRAAAHRDA